MRETIIKALAVSTLGLSVAFSAHAESDAWGLGEIMGTENITIQLNAALSKTKGLVFFRDGKVIQPSELKRTDTFCILALNPDAKPEAFAPGLSQSMSSDSGIMSITLGKLSFQGLGFRNPQYSNPVRQLGCYTDNADPLGPLVFSSHTVRHAFGDLISFTPLPRSYASHLHVEQEHRRAKDTRGEGSNGVTAAITKASADAKRAD